MEYGHPAATGLLFWEDGRVTKQSDGSVLNISDATTLRAPKRISRSPPSVRLAWIFATLFVPNPSQLPYVVHIGKKTNHSPKNLKWSEENADIVKHIAPVRCSSDFDTYCDTDGTPYKIHVEFPTWKVYLTSRMVNRLTGKTRSVSSKGKPYNRLKNTTSGMTFNVSRIMTELYNPIKVAEGQVIDHVDGNKRNDDMSLYNKFERIGNLEIVSVSENISRARVAKRALAGNTLPTCVYFNKSTNKFTVAMSCSGKLLYFGNYTNLAEASVVRNRALFLRDGGQLDALNEYYESFDKTYLINRYELHESRVVRWTGLKDSLDPSCKWNEEFPGYYGKDGKVFRLDDHRPMKTLMDCTGYYLKVRLLNKDRTPRPICVHKYLAFLKYGKWPAPGYVVCHGIGGSLDNRFENLRYATQKDNMADIPAHAAERKRKRDNLIGEPEYKYIRTESISERKDGYWPVAPVAAAIPLIPLPAILPASTSTMPIERLESLFPRRCRYTEPDN